jgi:hypothetical protein
MFGSVRREEVIERNEANRVDKREQAKRTGRAASHVALAPPRRVTQSDGGADRVPGAVVQDRLAVTRQGSTRVALGKFPLSSIPIMV